MSNRIYVSKQWLTFTLGSSEEHEVSVILRFQVRPGCAATREQPADDPEVEILSAKVTSAMDIDGVDVPPWMMRLINGDGELALSLAEEAGEDDLAAADDAAERRHDERRAERAARQSSERPDHSDAEAA